MDKGDGNGLVKKDGRESIWVLSRWNRLNSIAFVFGVSLVVMFLHGHYRLTVLNVPLLVLEFGSIGVWIWLLVKWIRSAEKTKEDSFFDFYDELIFFITLSFSCYFVVLIRIQATTDDQHLLALINEVELVSGVVIIVISCYTRKHDYLVRFPGSVIKEYISTCRFRLDDEAIEKCAGPDKDGDDFRIEVHFMNSEAVAISWKDVEDPTVLLVESNGTNRREQKHLLDLFGAAPDRQA